MDCTALPSWRSLLFIPANNDKFISKAHTRGADAIILDLEDSIAPSQKQAARMGLASAIGSIAEHGVDVLVRVNAETLVQDLSAASTENTRAVVIPKVANAATILQVNALLSAFELERNLTSGQIKILAQIEDVAALPWLDDIATAHSRLVGMSLGSEDFSVSVSMSPTNETLYWPNLQVAYACRRANILPYGFPDSITLIKDTHRLEQAVQSAVDMGMVGALCIHPAQADVLNRLLTPSEKEISNANRLIEEFERFNERGEGVFIFDGKMVDLPVVTRARELVNRAKNIVKINKFA